MARHPKVYNYYRYSNKRASGTIREISAETGRSIPHLSNLAARSRANTIKRRDSYEFMEYLYTQIPEYALYVGENIVADGTLEEISEQTGLKVDSIYFYSTPSARKRGNRVLVRIDDDEEEQG